ncbi:SIS domain-containing protein [Neobacillus niacini]|uniref:D-sedoheptulose-7-phosphate isomerase n=1 Tax=Neobacillus niacini TaxID=86668 RepID=UPI0021CAE61B|nr:SIS domain-containing protein [Neobacillus niacini]MCM3763516.1 SIS domain-containing protein [Neobacillus niacini]
MKESTRMFVTNLVERYPVLESCSEAVSESIQLLIESYKNGNKLLTCGNGGSAADAIHIVGELMKAFVLPRKLSDEEQEKIKQVSQHSDYICKNLQGALPAISLVSETSLITAYSNDMAPDLAFAQQVYGYGQPGDVLLAISTSGNSSNVIYACEVAKAKGVKVISLTGDTGGKLKALSDVLINVPEKETYKIQELHLPVYHTICLALESEFFGE